MYYVHSRTGKSFWLKFSFVKFQYLLTPLHLAVNNGNTAMVAFLLEHQAKVDCVDVNKRSALMFGCIIGNLPIVELLIQNGANIRLKDNEGFTALKYAQLYHHVECKMAVLDARKHPRLTQSDNSTNSSRAGVCFPTNHSQGCTDEGALYSHGTKKALEKTSSSKSVSVLSDKAHMSVPKIFIENDEVRYQPIGSEPDGSDVSSVVGQFVEEVDINDVSELKHICEERSPLNSYRSNEPNQVFAQEIEVPLPPDVLQLTAPSELHVNVCDPEILRISQASQWNFQQSLSQLSLFSNDATPAKMCTMSDVESSGYSNMKASCQ
ncbi:hypothetical protein AHF37_11923, partial [Paragonimus kellicotti]